MALNSYIQSEEIIKLSDETIFKTAYSLTHIVRFCENNKIKFSHFSENDFVAFSHSLQEEDRENKTTVFILSNTLNFFNYFGRKFLDIENYCIDILHCFYKKHITKSNKETKSLYHVCFPTKEPTKRRSPVSLGNIEKMYENVPKTSDSNFV